MQTHVQEFFEGVKAKRHPPPEEKVDLVKAKRTLDALRKPAKSPLRTNYERITEQTYLQAQRSGTTVSAKRSKERAKRKKFAQLGEQAQQSCPPLNVSNAPGTVAGYGNLDEYLPDDALPDFLEVDEHRYEYGKPLVKDEKSLTTMMRRFHNWYMETCRESEGKNALYLHIKEEHDLVANDLLTVPFDEFFAFFNQKALDKLMVFCYCL